MPLRPSLEELLCKIWSFDVKRCGGRYDSLTFGSSAANGASMGASRALTFKTTQGHPYPWGTCTYDYKFHSNHGSISYVYSFRGKRRHRSKKQCFPTPGVVPSLSEIWAERAPTSSMAPAPMCQSTLTFSLCKQN